MSRRRILVAARLAPGTVATLTGNERHYLATVLRLKPGTELILADGAGREFIGSIDRVDSDGVEIAIGDELPALQPEGPVITIYQGMPKGEKLELILQKGTELGVGSIVPFYAARSVPRLRDERIEGRLARWERIAREAARQCGRPDTPQLGLAGNLADVLRMGEHSVKLLLWEGEKAVGLRQLLADTPRPDNVAVIIGPEGGLTGEEVAAAREAGYRSVTMGTRILRTETAGLAILAILQHVWGDLG